MTDRSANPRGSARGPARPEPRGALVSGFDSVEQALADGADERDVLAYVVDFLQIAIANVRLYGFKHDQTRAAMRRVSVPLGSLLDRMGEVELETGPEGLSWDGRLLRPESEDQPGLGAQLHREGIAAITLRAGLDDLELARFIAVLRINLGLPEYEEETLDSLLWQAGFKRIEHEPVSSLMDAEAMSGRLRLRTDDPLTRTLEGILELDVGGREAVRRRLVDREEPSFGKALSDGLAGGRREDLESTRIDAGDPWEKSFAEEALADDRRRVAAMIEDLEADEEGGLALKTLALLVRAAAANRVELPTSAALALADRLVGDLSYRGHFGALQALIEQNESLLADEAVAESRARDEIADFLQVSFEPARLVRGILRIQPGTNVDLDALGRLVDGLPDVGLAAVLEAAGEDPDPARRELLVTMLAGLPLARLETWVGGLHAQAVGRLLPLIEVLRRGRSPAGAEHRRRFLQHAEPRVREAAVRWYGDDLPREDVDEVLDRLGDRDRSVRRAVVEVLSEKRPPSALAWFERRLRTRLPEDEAAVRELCIACGRIGQDGAVAVLEPLLDAGGGGLRRDKAGEPLLRGAAYGLAAIGTAQALRALHKGQKGWNRSRKQACSDALKAHEEGRLR